MIICFVNRLPFRNGKLDSDEIWWACRTISLTHCWQISSESNVPFARYYGWMELVRLTGSRQLSVGFRASTAVQDGLSDRLEIRRASSLLNANWEELRRPSLHQPRVPPLAACSKELYITTRVISTKCSLRRPFSRQPRCQPRRSLRTQRKCNYRSNWYQMLIEKTILASVALPTAALATCSKELSTRVVSTKCSLTRPSLRQPPCQPRRSPRAQRNYNYSSN